MKQLNPSNLLLLITGIILYFVTAFSYSLFAQISFDQGNLDFNGQGDISAGVTSLMYGPDGRLYVQEYPGTIKILTIQRNGAANYVVTDVEVLTGVIDIVNYDDDGSPCSGFPSDCAKRETTGLTVAGTAQFPVIYVTSSDFRIGSGSGGGKGDIDLDTNSGTITRLSWNGSSWDVVDLVRGLPRSEENHATNGLEFVNINGTNYLVVAQGGNSNGGSPSINFVYHCEYALSGAVLSIDLDAINAMSTKTDGNGRKYIYDLPTLDDPTRANANGITDPNHSSYNGVDVNDPFGGNDGLNQAIIVPGGPVQILSPGYRNAYDLVVTESGALYVTENGANMNWGGLPVNEGSGSVTNDYIPGEPGGSSSNPAADGEYVNNLDHLELVTTNLDSYTFGSFYAGHPNPIRANPSGAGLFTAPEQYGLTGAVFRTQTYDPNGSTPGSTTDPDQALPANWPPVTTANPVEGDWRGPGMNNPDGPNDNLITIWGTNTNGIDEYTASNFGGAMKGDLIAGHHSGKLRRVELKADGTLQKLTQSFLSGSGGNALGISCNSDSEIFPGTIWVGTLNGNIAVFEPADYGTTGTPTITQNLPDLVRFIDAPDENINLDNYFDDDQGTGNLTYTVEQNTDPSIGASIAGNMLTLSFPSSQGMTNITIRATDSDTNFIEQTFTVTVLENANTLIRINAGGPDLNYNGDLFNADQYYSGGSSYKNNNALVPELFKSERTASSLTFNYNIPVANGDYTVVLHFAEIYWGATGGDPGGIGSRIFDVNIEGNLVLDNYDIIADVGTETPVAKTFSATVNDNELNINFSSLASVGGVNQPKVSAIEVIGDGNGNLPPIAMASAVPTTGEVPLEVSFTGDNSTDDVGVTSYSWDFMDGSPLSSLPNPVHTFTTSGTYHVELTVEDAEGLSDTDTITIEVTEPPNEAPVAVASGMPSSGVAPMEVSFSGSNSTDDKAIVSYLWDFDDGSPTSNQADPTHTFTTGGTYQVTLTVEDAEGLTDSDTVIIVVNDAVNQPPTAVATASPTNGLVPLSVTFSASNSVDDQGITSYVWDFDDGSPTSSEENPTYTFTNTGTYHVELTVTDAEGLDDSDTVIIVVREPSNQAPVAVISATPSEGVAPLEVAFSANNSTDDQSVVSYLWDFDDGSPTSTLISVSHIFIEPGTYQVLLTVEDNLGLTDSDVANIVVTEAGSTKDIVSTLLVNPATNFAKVQIIDNSTKDTKVSRITIHDLSGRLVSQYNPGDVIAHGIFEIPISNLSDGGIYFIGFQMDTGQSITLKLMVRN